MKRRFVLAACGGLATCNGRSADTRVPPVAPAKHHAGETIDLAPGAGAPVTRLLDRLAEARFVLPPLHTPGTGGEFTLADGWTQGAWPRLWQHPLPVRLPQKQYRAIPPGTSLTRAGIALQYVPGLAVSPAITSGWEVHGNNIYLAAPSDPNTWDAPPVFHHAPTKTAEARLDPARAKLAEAAYARKEVTVGITTEDALIVPAGGSVTFTATIPDDGKLRFDAALVPPPAVRARTRARLVVEIDGQVIWARDTRSAEEWQQAFIDLGPWSGRSVQLRFSTVPTGSSSAPTVGAFGQPTIVGHRDHEHPRHIVLVGIDTLRPDHLSANGYHRPTSPNMTALASRSVVFDHAWSPAPRTRPSFRTVLTGRWPLPAITATSLGRILYDHGFETAGVVANAHLAPRLGFAHGYERWDYETNALAEDQVRRAMAWQEPRSREDTFLFIHLMDPHVFYVAPPPYTDLFTRGLDRQGLADRFNRWTIARLQSQGRLTDAGKKWIEARYDGEIAYTDHWVGELVRQIDQLEGDTLLVVLSDHGEEFWEHGGYEHNHTLYDEVMRVLLWFRPPGGVEGPVRVHHPVSLADVVPTLLEAARVPRSDWPPLDGISLLSILQNAPEVDRAAHLDQQLDDRLLPMGHLMFGKERWGVVARQHKYILWTASGKEELYDLVHDPAEQHDLAETADLAPWRADLAKATGWPVGPGWRVELKGQRKPFSLEFEQPVRRAGVIDPEAQLERRANLEWGEVPMVLPQDVARVTLSGDRRTVTVTPGKKPRGIIYIMGPTPTAKARVDGGPETVGVGMHILAGRLAKITAGEIIVPQETEAHYLAQAADPNAIKALRALGYVE